jgi:hypothetical protein
LGNSPPASWRWSPNGLMTARRKSRGILRVALSCSQFINIYMEEQDDGDGK